MKFLLANNHMPSIGGSESFTREFAHELVRRGHSVRVIDATGKLWVSHNENEGPFDAAFLSHNTTVDLVVQGYDIPLDRIIQTIHGRAHRLEKPSQRPIRFVAVSQELGEMYDCPVIMNGVNLEKFRPGKKEHRVLSMCQSDRFNAMLKPICESEGYEFQARNKHTNPTWAIQDEMATAEVVIGLGRSAIEAMACGCAVIVADDREYQGALYDGVITEGTYHELAKANFSGRRYGDRPDAELLLIALQSIQSLNGARCRWLAEQHHDIRQQVGRYLQLINGE